MDVGKLESRRKEGKTRTCIEGMVNRVLIQEQFDLFICSC